jgi:predicted ArsR family transcriptional regulator
LGDNLSALSEALFTEVGSGFKVEMLAKYLAGEAHLAGQPLAKRLNLTVEKLNQMNYHARWEAGSEGPRVIFAHCPYASIIEKHPELCRMDQALLNEWMGGSARQVFKAGTEGSSVCVFVIGK